MNGEIESIRKEHDELDRRAYALGRVAAAEGQSHKENPFLLNPSGCLSLADYWADGLRDGPADRR